MVKLRYKEPDGDTSRLLTFVVTDAVVPFEEASESLRFSAAVAAFGMILRDSEHRGGATLDLASAIAQDSLGEDRGGYRREFLDLLRRAEDILIP